MIHIDVLYVLVFHSHYTLVELVGQSVAQAVEPLSGQLDHVVEVAVKHPRPAKLLRFKYTSFDVVSSIVDSCWQPVVQCFLVLVGQLHSQLAGSP